MDSLAVALPLFLVSATVVVIGGIGLARYGDELAELTGWGHLWVGTILVAVGTSLPELITNISAVSIDEAPLALGNIFGANMVNMFVLAMVALIFGAGRFFSGLLPETRLLAAVAIAMTGLAVVIGGTEVDVTWQGVGIGALALAAVYLVGMRIVYAARSDTGGGAGPDAASAVARAGVRRTWLLFLGSGALIAASAPLLAISADGIADSTGLAGSFVGIVLVSVVTTLPEATVSVTAVRRGVYTLALGNVYGSCAFNVFIITFVDPIHREGSILEAMEPEHFVAGGLAVLLMSLGLLGMLTYRPRRRTWLWGLLATMAAVYPAGLFWVYILA